jgi:hypothetical protein
MAMLKVLLSLRIRRRMGQMHHGVRSGTQSALKSGHEISDGSCAAPKFELRHGL